MTGDEPWGKVSFVKRSKYRLAALKSLYGSHWTPTGLAKDTGMDVTHISRSIREMRDEGLVELLVSEDTRKGRIYGITDEGKRVMNLIETDIGG